MEALKLITQYVEASWAYTSFCISAPFAAPACRSFWMGIAIASAAIGLIVLFKVLVRMVKYYQAVRAEARRQAELQRVADEETMVRHRWEGDNVLAASAGEDAAQRIREALDDRKRLDQRRERGASDDSGPVV